MVLPPILVSEVSVGQELQQPHNPSRILTINHGSNSGYRVRIAGEFGNRIVAATTGGLYVFCIEPRTLHIHGQVKVQLSGNEQAAVTDLARMHDNYIATCGSDGKVVVWDVKEARLVDAYPVTQSELTSVAVVNVKYLVAGSRVGMMYLLSFDSDEMKLHKEFQILAHGAFDEPHKGHPVVNLIYYLRLERGIIKMDEDNGKIQDISAFDGRIVTAGDDGFAVEWKLVRRRRHGHMHRLEMVNWFKHDARVMCVALNKTRLVTISRNAIFVRKRMLGVILPNPCIVRECHERSIHRVILHCGHVVTSSDDGKIAVLDLKTMPSAPLVLINSRVADKGTRNNMAPVQDFDLLASGASIAVVGRLDHSVHIMDLDEHCCTLLAFENFPQSRRTRWTRQIGSHLSILFARIVGPDKPAVWTEIEIENWMETLDVDNINYRPLEGYNVTWRYQPSVRSGCGEVIVLLPNE